MEKHFVKHPLSTPLSVAQISPTTGVYANSKYVGDKEGFMGSILDKWMSHQNAHPTLETIQHFSIAERLYDFYVELRNHVDALSPDDNPKRALLQVSIHELMRGGTFEDATALLRKHAQFISRSDQAHDSDALVNNPKADAIADAQVSLNDPLAQPVDQPSSSLKQSN